MPRGLRLADIDSAAVPGHGLVRRAVVGVLGVVGVAAIIALIVAMTVTIDVTVDAAGTIEPQRVWPVRMLEPGRIAAILVNTGDTVRRGQVLARLDVLDARSALEQLRARVAQRSVDIERAAAAESLQASERVLRLARADARVVATRAAMRRKLGDFGLGGNVDSVLTVYRPGAHTELDVAVSEVRSAEADRKSAEAELGQAHVAQLDQARVRIELDALRAELRHGERRLDRLSIASPTDGVVLTERVERLLGAMLASGDELLQVGDASAWDARLVVTERELHKVRVGERVRLTIPALRLVHNAPLDGRVVALAPSPFAAAPGVSAVRGGGYEVRVSVAVDALPSHVVAQLRTGYTVEARIVDRSARIITVLRDMLFATR